MTHLKHFKGESTAAITHEVHFQTHAASLNLAPRVLDTDYKTYIRMDRLDALSIADMYGENIKNIPRHIMSQIWSILWTLYNVCNIEYVDVTGYNFIERAGRVWVVDFGDARHRSAKLDPYLKQVFDKGVITKWNSKFA